VVLPLLWLAVAGCLVVAGWALWFVVRDRPVILKQLLAAAVVEAVLVVQAVVAGVQQVTQGRAVDGPLFWGYLITAAIVLPIAAAWAFAERTKWSSVVLLVAAVTVAFLQWRLWQIWEAAA